MRAAAAGRRNEGQGYDPLAGSKAQDILESREVLGSGISGPPGHSRIPWSELGVYLEQYSLLKDVGSSQHCKSTILR